MSHEEIEKIEEEIRPEPEEWFIKTVKKGVKKELSEDAINKFKGVPGSGKSWTKLWKIIAFVFTGSFFFCVAQWGSAFGDFLLGFLRMTDFVPIRFPLLFFIAWVLWFKWIWIKDTALWLLTLLAGKYDKVDRPTMEGMYQDELIYHLLDKTKKHTLTRYEAEELGASENGWRALTEKLKTINVMYEDFDNSKASTLYDDVDEDELIDLFRDKSKSSQIRAFRIYNQGEVVDAEFKETEPIFKVKPINNTKSKKRKAGKR